ncbi:MAG: hypothetical protein SGJ27_26525 [Candidatus Melainabacteria bacterium]|nr:hypothetical protein [Candidatus Melainabacteria bacterium]
MNRLEFMKLLALKDYPSLSILLPTHRCSPDNLQDPIRVKNSVSEATKRLVGEFGELGAAEVIKRLNAIVEQIDSRTTLDGLAIFVNKQVSKKYYLPFTLTERVVIGESFAIRDLLFAMNRSPRYLVLVLSEKPTRLYDGYRDSLVEVEECGFPFTQEDNGGITRAGIDASAYRDDRHRQFFREVDKALGEVLKQDPLPLIVVGVERYLAFFDEVSANKAHLAGTLHGSHDSTTPSELVKLIWPIVQDHFRVKRESTLDQLSNAIGQKKYAAGFDEVWKVASEGRIEKLLVEEDFYVGVTPEVSGINPKPVENSTIPGVHDDAVDQIIEKVLHTGGLVTFYNPGKLSNHSHLAAILRY